jgi:very-short-patch-repair endonuclease
MTTFRTRLARYLRRTMSPTQARLWDRLRARQLEGWKFRSQHPIGPYFVAFYCPAVRLVIDIDETAGELDPDGIDSKRRSSWLEARGYRVMRVTPEEVDQSLNAVVDAIYREVLDIAARLQLGIPAGESRVL